MDPKAKDWWRFVCGAPFDVKPEWANAAHPRFVRASMQTVGPLGGQIMSLPRLGCQKIRIVCWSRDGWCGRNGLVLQESAEF